MRIFLTGAAGFIGFHVATRLLNENHQVYGFDSLNDYYDPWYKQLRLNQLEAHKNFFFRKALLEDSRVVSSFYDEASPDIVIHLAAQAGVRYSIDNPMAYISANIVGFQNIIECVRRGRPKNFIYASSSSVYGLNKTLPFSESQEVKNPLSLYAASKLTNELVARSYWNLFQIPSVGLRFFTVYGPYGRPDMALFKFAKSIMNGEKLQLYNRGEMWRDFTFIDDIVDGVIRSINCANDAKVFNLGRGKKEKLIDMLTIVEASMGKPALIEFEEMQLGDVNATHADISYAEREIGYSPCTTIAEGIPRFCQWFKETEAVRKLQND